MCLMHTDFPVPDGPRIIEILSLGDAHVQAAQDLVAAERLVDLDELDRVLLAVRALLARVPLVLVVRVVLALRSSSRSPRARARA